jgi:hypothetical protein
VKVHRYLLADDEVFEQDGLLVTTGPRTLADLSPYLPHEALAAVGDVVLRGWGAESVAESVRRSRRRPGYGRLLRVVPVLDPGSDSPAETRGRLRLHAAGFTALRHKVTVTDAHGGWLAVPDLADPEARVAWQYDGVEHFRPGDEARRRKDVERDELVREQGWQVVVSTSVDDMQPTRLIRKMTQAYLRAAQLWGRHVLPPFLR